MILRACREVAKHTPFLLSELGPRNAATEEELRNGREKMRPNAMPENGPRIARISEREKLGVNLSSHFQRLISAHDFTTKESLATPDIRHLSHVCRTTHRRSALQYKRRTIRQTSPRQFQKTGESIPTYKEAKKGGNVRRKINFSLS